MSAERTVITDKPEHYEVAAGASATFRCNANADDSLQLEIVWLNDGQPIEFDAQPRFRVTNDYSLLISDTTELDSGEYTCIARTQIDEARAQATLTVQGDSHTQNYTPTFSLFAPMCVVCPVSKINYPILHEPTLGV